VYYCKSIDDVGYRSIEKFNVIFRVAVIAIVVGMRMFNRSTAPTFVDTPSQPKTTTTTTNASTMDDNDYFQPPAPGSLYGASAAGYGLQNIIVLLLYKLYL
jgi:hypothetical protein